MDFELDLSKKGRGIYDQDEFIFKRGDNPYKNSAGKLTLRSKKGGDKVVAKLYSDIDGDGKFTKDELIFKGSATGDDIYDRLKGSSGKIKWDYNDCTPCLREPFNFLVLNPDNSKKVEFFEIGFMGNLNNSISNEPLDLM